MISACMFNVNLREFIIIKDEIVDTSYGYCEGPIINVISYNLNNLVLLSNIIAKAEWLSEHEIKDEFCDDGIQQFLTYTNCENSSQTFLDYIKIKKWSYMNLYADNVIENSREPEYIEKCKKYLKYDYDHNSGNDDIIVQAHKLHDRYIFATKGCIEFTHQDGKDCSIDPMDGVCGCSNSMFWKYNTSKVDWLKKTYLHINSAQGFVEDDVTKTPYFSLSKE